MLAEPEPERADQVVAWGPVLAAAEPAPCRPRDRLEVAGTASVGKASAAVLALVLEAMLLEGE